MERMLVIIPCGSAKIWDRHPHTGPTLARDVYQGAPFRVNRKYAERFAERWVILSAKYGFISPDFVIPGPYCVTFKRPSPECVTVAALREQVVAQGLAEYPLVVGLGGADYRKRVYEAFAPWPVQTQFPFAGLNLPAQMKATSRAVKSGEPFPDHS